MTSRNIYLVICLVLLAPFITGCKKNNQPPEKVIKVGVLLGFGGTGAQNAIETKAALDICLQDAKDYIARNEIDAAIEILLEDTQSDTTQAKAKAQLLVDQGVRLIIGPYTSAEARAVKSIVDANNVLLVTHSAVSTSLAIANDNLLRFSPSDSYQAEAINAMFRSDSIQALIPVVRNDLWSNSLITAVSPIFRDHSGTVLQQQTFQPGTTDFSTVAAGVKSAVDEAIRLYGVEKTGIYLISYGDGTGFIDALSRVGLNEKTRIYGASAFAQSVSLTDNINAAGFAESLRLQCPVFGFDTAAEFIYGPIQTRMMSTIGSPASIYALAAYDILWTGMLTCLTLEPEPEFSAFKTQFIETAAEYYGATGRTELNEFGDRKHAFYDFWAVRKVGVFYTWQLSAKYSTTDQSLKRF